MGHFKAPIDDDTCIKEATTEVPLRFKEGDGVACRCSVWEHGTVINNWWYDNMQGISHPYQVKLDDGGLIFAPNDCNSCIQESLQNVDPKKRDISSSVPSTPQMQPSKKLLKKKKDIKLRFKVGDRVQYSLVGNQSEHWEPGIVVKLWYEEDGDIYPYRIRLDSKEVINAPLHSERFIKVSTAIMTLTASNLFQLQGTLPSPADLFPEKNDPLFEEPVMKENDCPICVLPLPDQCVFQPCCGKEICYGCFHAASTFETVERDMCVRVIPCPFCRTPGAKNGNDIITRLRKRVESNDPSAATTLAIFYHNGQHGLQKNYKKSFELHKLSEELGSTESLSPLGWAYWKGEGVKRDMDKARHYLERAALDGDVFGRENLAWIEIEEGNPWKAYKHFVIAAKFGMNEALKEVREGYSSGFVSKEEFSDVLRSFQELMIEKSSTQRDKAAEYDAYEKKS